MITVTLSPEWATLAEEIAVDVAGYLNSALDKAGEGIAANMRAAFENEGIRAGQDQWQQTSRIAASKRKNPPSAVDLMSGNYKTLVDTGALRDSIDGKAVRGNQGYVLVVGTDRDYAPLMQFGGPSSVDGVAITVPPRPFIDLTDEDLATLEAALEEGSLSG